MDTCIRLKSMDYVSKTNFSHLWKIGWESRIFLQDTSMVIMEDIFGSFKSFMFLFAEWLWFVPLWPLHLYASDVTFSLGLDHSCISKLTYCWMIYVL